MDQGGTRAAGFAEVVEPATPLADIVDHIQAQTGIAAPEAVDGLLGIADEQHLIGQGGQAGKEGELDGAGILEFIHHQQPQPGAQPVTGAGVLKGAQHQILLINEVQQAPCLLEGREGRHDVRRGGEQAADEGRDVGVKAGAFKDLGAILPGRRQQGYFSYPGIEIADPDPVRPGKGGSAQELIEPFQRGLQSPGGVDHLATGLPGHPHGRAQTRLVDRCRAGWQFLKQSGDGVFGKAPQVFRGKGVGAGLIDEAEHLALPVLPSQARRQGVQCRRDLRGQALIQGLIEQELLVAVGDHPLDGGEPQLETQLLQELAADAVHGADPRLVEERRQVGAAAGEQAGADPFQQLIRGAVGEGDGDQPFRAEPAGFEPGGDVLDDAVGLAGTGPGMAEGDGHDENPPRVRVAGCRSAPARGRWA